MRERCDFREEKYPRSKYPVLLAGLALQLVIGPMTEPGRRRVTLSRSMISSCCQTSGPQVVRPLIKAFSGRISGHILCAWRIAWARIPVVCSVNPNHPPSHLDTGIDCRATGWMHGVLGDRLSRGLLRDDDLYTYRIFHVG